MTPVLIISVCYKHFLFLPPFWTDLAIFCSWAECLIKQVMPLEPVGMLEWNDFCQSTYSQDWLQDAQQQGKGIKCSQYSEDFQVPTWPSFGGVQFQKATLDI